MFRRCLTRFSVAGPRAAPDRMHYHAPSQFSIQALDYQMHGPTTQLREKYFELFQDGIFSQLTSSRTEGTVERLRAVLQSGLLEPISGAKDPVRCLVGHEMMGMSDPYTSTALLYHNIVAAVLQQNVGAGESEKVRGLLEDLLGGRVLGCFSSDTIYSFPREKGSQCQLKSVPTPEYAQRPAVVANASFSEAGPVIMPAWVKSEGSKPTLNWICTKLSDLNLTGSPGLMHRLVEVDGVQLPTHDTVLHTVRHGADDVLAMPRLYHAATCLGVSKMLLYNTAHYLDRKFHHEVSPPYAELGFRATQSEFVPLLAECVVYTIAMTLPPILKVPFGMYRAVTGHLENVAAVVGRSVDEVALRTTANRAHLFLPFARAASRVLPEQLEQISPSSSWATKGAESSAFLLALSKIPIRLIRRRAINSVWHPNNAELGRMTILLKYRETVALEELKLSLAAHNESENVEALAYAHRHAHLIRRIETAHTERLVYESCVAFLRATNDKELRDPLGLCVWMYGLTRLQKDLAWYDNSGILARSHNIQIEEAIENLSGQLANQAVHYVDSLAIPQMLRRSPMANF
eukprot:PhM_4_TR1370/c0_g1_i1/m.40367